MCTKCQTPRERTGCCNKSLQCKKCNRILALDYCNSNTSIKKIDNKKYAILLRE